MRIEFYKVYNQVHTWTGIIAGMLLYICFISGALTMFKTPINQWALQTEASLPPIPLQKYDQLIQSTLIEHPEAQKNLTVYLPEAQPQHAPISWLVENEETHTTVLWHATLTDNNQLVTQKASVSAIGDFFDHLHRTAGIPGGTGHDAIGTYIMGIIAALYFIAIVSGLIIFLPNWFKDLFTLRRGKNRKRFWLDIHNILGISALPFHIIIAITTFAFAYHDIIYDSMKVMVYDDTPMFNRPAPNPSNQTIDQLATVDQLTASIHALEPEFKAAMLNFRNLDTPRANVLIGGKMDGQWVRGPDYAYTASDPYSAIPGYTMMLPNQPGVMNKIVNGFFTLHFGGFGGYPIRWIYFALGITGSLLFLTGNILWIEARQKKQTTSNKPVQQKRSVLIMARLTVGMALGTLMGMALSLIAVKCLPHSTLDITWWQQVAYYTGFVLCIFWAFLQRPFQAAKQQILMLVALIGLLSILSLTNFYIDQLSAVHWIFFIGSLLSAGWLVAILFWMRRREKIISAESVWG